MRNTAKATVICGAAVFALAAGASGAFAELPVTLTIDSGTVAVPGSTAALCVSIDTGGEAVAGTENQLHWDPSCRPVVEGCRANPAHGKTLFYRINDEDFLPEPFLKTIVISFDNSDPIPDGELYCCNFVADLEQPGDCCEVRIEQPLASSPDAMQLDTVAGSSGFLCLDPNAPPSSPIVPDTRTPTWTPSPQAPTATPTPTFHDTESTATPGQPFRTATRFATPGPGGTIARGGHDEDDGCQVAGNDARPLDMMLLLLPATLLLLRRRAARQRTTNRR